MTKNLLALLSISDLAFSVGLASAPAAFAQHKMSKDGMKKHDAMAKDGMTKDGMKK
jgi:pentapeptide MXKDX repeat protein